MRPVLVAVMVTLVCAAPAAAAALTGTLMRINAEFRLTANRALSRVFRSEDIVRIDGKWLMYAISASPK